MRRLTMASTIATATPIAIETWMVCWRVSSKALSAATASARVESAIDFIWSRTTSTWVSISASMARTDASTESAYSRVGTSFCTNKVTMPSTPLRALAIAAFSSGVSASCASLSRSPNASAFSAANSLRAAGRSRLMTASPTIR